MNPFSYFSNLFADKKKKTNVRAGNYLGVRASARDITGESPDAERFNPDKILKTNNERQEVYRDFLYDPHLKSCVQSRKAGVLSLEWQINQNDADKAITEFIEEIFKSLRMRKILNEMLDAPLYGYKPLEILWTIKDEKIVVRDIVGKPPEWFSFNNNGLLLFKSVTHSQGEVMPAKKFLNPQHEATYDNPYGQALIGVCYYPVIFKKGGLQLWAKFVQKYGMPYLHGQVMQGTQREQIEAFYTLLDDLKQDMVVVTEEDENIELKSATGSSSPVYEALIKLCNAEISKAILSQTLTTETGGVGSNAMAKTHFDVKKEVVDADKTMVEEELNTLIKWIIDLNFGTQEVYPSFDLFEEEQVDKVRAERDAILSNNIIFSKEYYQKNYNLKEDEFELKEQSQDPIKKEEQEEPQDDEEFAEPDKKEMQKNGIKQFNQSVNVIVQDIVKRLDKTESFEELEKEIVALYPHLKTDEVEKHIQDAILLASVSGSLSVRD